MMPPLLMRMHVLLRDGHSFRLWIPLFAVWLLLLPLALFVLPIVFIACVVFDVDPIAAIGSVLAILASLSGTHIEVDAPNAFVFFHII
jgi:hypothetical protein